MITRWISTLVFAVATWAPFAAGTSGDSCPAFLYAAEGAEKLIQYGTGGKVVWEYPAAMSRDAWVLPNRHVLFCFNLGYDGSKHTNSSGVIEVTPEKKVVFSFSTTGQVWSCQRMMDGNTLVGAASQGKLLVVNPQAKVIRSLQVLNTPGHSCMRNARQIANGHFLVAEESAHAVREYSPEGSLEREIRVSFAPFSAVRLKNGNTVVCGQQSIVEIAQDEKVLWSLNGGDYPELGVRWFAGIQVLPNKNLFVCNAGGKVPFIEISPNKQIVWHSPSHMSFALGHGVQRLDVEGDPQR
jgi:hypothetical protein